MENDRHPRIFHRTVNVTFSPFAYGFRTCVAGLPTSNCSHSCINNRCVSVCFSANRTVECHSRQVPAVVVSDSGTTCNIVRVPVLVSQEKTQFRGRLPLSVQFLTKRTSRRTRRSSKTLPLQGFSHFSPVNKVLGPRRWKVLGLRTDK